MERLVAKKQSEHQKQMIKKKTNLFPPSPVIIWIQQGSDFFNWYLIELL